MIKSLKDEYEKIKKWGSSDRAEIETEGRGIIYRDPCVYDEDGIPTADRIRMIFEHGEAAGYLVCTNCLFEDRQKKDIRHFFMENDSSAGDALAAYLRILQGQDNDLADAEDLQYVCILTGILTEESMQEYADDLISVTDMAAHGNHVTLLLPESCADMTEELMNSNVRKVKPILIRDSESDNAKNYILVE